MAGISMNELTTYRWSFEDDVQRYRTAGFQAISVWRPKLSEFGEEQGVELLRESGLRAASLLWVGGFTGSDGRSFSDAVDDAQEAVRVAATLRAGCLTVYAGARGGHTRNHARRLLRMALRELAPMAAQYAVTIALEPMHVVGGSDLTFLNSVDETLEIIRETGHDRVKLALDTYHFGRDPSVLAQLPQWVSQLAMVQLADSRMGPCVEQNRCRLGEGTVPLPAIVQTLTAAGYQGDYDIELMGEELGPNSYEELLVHSRRYVSRLLANPGRAAG